MRFARRACWLLAGLAAGVGVVRAQMPADAAMQRLVRGRFTVVYAPSEHRLATSIADSATARDTFPGLPRPTKAVEIQLAPNAATFRQWAGRFAPEWGQGFAFPEEHRVLLHGRNGPGGSPFEVLRHELAHLALNEHLGELPPRWFDEGYASFAAGEWGRDDVLATNFALAIAFGRMPSLASLDSAFHGGATAAQAAYAFSFRAVAELATLDRARGLSLFFTYWREERAFDPALRRAFGITQAGFEQRWHQATRRRYGGLAVVTDVGAAALLVFLLVGPLWLVRRQRDRKRLEAMRLADEAQAERERQSALAALLGESGIFPPH